MKTHLTKRILALLLTLIMVLSLIPMTFAEEAKSNDLVILYTNDVHCGVDQNDSSIGVAGLAKVKKELEAAHENVALVDNGDFIQGELIGTVSRGEYLVQLMNYLGYDYGTFGNHEYDYTMPQLKNLVDMANMTYLSCNFQYIGPGEDPNAVDVDGYEVVDYNGLKVGYVGITTPESLVKSTPTYFQDENGEWIYTFCNGGDGQDLYDAVQVAVDAARAEGAQVVVALAHLGIDEQSSPWMSTEVIANTTGINVMLDGHSHSTIARQEVANKNGETVLLSSTGTKLANIGKLTITPEGAVNTELIARADVDGVDEDTQAYLDQIKAQYEELTHQVVAHTDYDLLTTDPETGARMVRMRETNLGDVCADAYRTILDADVAFVNGGGIRANIDAGDVTYEQIIKVHPYSNMACKVKTTGQQILDALEMASRNVTIDEDGNLLGENGGFLQVAGLKYTIDTAIPSSVVVDEAKMFVRVDGLRRVKNVQILQADGTYAPIDREAEYTLASHNYMLKQGGDGINMFMHDELLLDEVKVDNQVLIEYMTSDAFAANDYSNWKGEGRINIYRSELPLEDRTVVLHTNDTHGALMGFAQVAQVRADYEAMGARVILVDAGDFSQGTTYVSTNKGAAAAQIMKLTGYDVVTLGNHEFDFGYDQLKQNLEDAELVTVCADVYMKDTGLSAFGPYTMYNLGGPYDWLKIGFFGMETPETQTKVNPGLITELEFGTNENGKFLSGAQNAIAGLKADGADVIIGLVHLGVDDESEPYRSIDLYNEIKDDVDFLIDGHSHTVMTEGPNGEPIQSTGTKASKTAFMNVGCIIINDNTKKIEDNYLIPLGEDAPVKPSVAAAVQEIMDAVDAEYGAVFAQSEVELNGDKVPGNRNMETNLGDLITDALLWGVMKDMDAETLGVPAENVVAITNGGGIRAWIHAGDVTKNDVNTVLPFGNTLAVVYVTGAELLEALEASTAFAPEGVGGFPQISGMKINIDTSVPYDEGELYPDSTYHRPNSIQRVTILKVNGKPFDPEATYAVVTNNFCAAGGDTYYVFKNASDQFDTGIPMDEVLMEYIKDELDGVIGQEYAEPQGRILQGQLELAGKTIILHTNDTHGALLGFAQVAQVKTDYENKGATVILADAGDFSQGTTYVSSNKGAAAVTMLNAAGYDFVTLGNHEFDFGYAQLMQNLGVAEFQALCADVFNKETGESILPPCAVKEIDGLKIGFFGMETPETQTKVNPGLITELSFGTNENGLFLSSARDAVAALKADGADLVIGLVHLGVDPESEPYRSFDLFSQVEGIDFLIDGHSHTVMTQGPNGEPIQSTGTKASEKAFMNLGCIVIDNETKTIEKNELIPLGADAPVDPEVAAIAQEIMDEVDAEYGAKFAESLVELNGDRAPGNRNEETNLGDLITDALKWTVMKDMDAEILGVPEENVVAVTNGGGIRAWIHAGDVTKNDVNTVLPFGNTVAVVYVSGAELLEALEASTYCTPTAVGGFPQVSGMNITIDLKKSFDGGELYPESTYHGPASIRRVTIQDVNGKAFDPEATYAVVTNDFCSAGGDTYYAFKAASSQFDTGVPMDEALMAYIVEELDGVIGEEYAEPQGRITLKNGFDDVQDPDKYYYEPVYWAYNHDPEITSGITPTTFGVKNACTRAQIVTFLYAVAGKPAVEAADNPFTDVKEGKWYYDAVMWAVQNDITGGMRDDYFGVNETCTRAQAVTFLYAMAGRPAVVTEENPFTDVPEGKWFREAVLWAYENGITGGTTPTTFSPNAKCTRAQIVTFLYAAEYKLKKMTFPSTDNADIEKYGNIYTDMDAAEFFDMGFTWGDIVVVKFLDQSLDLPIVPTYSYVDQNSPAVIVAKDGETGKPVGRVKMAINMGDFATTYGLATKTTNPDKTYFWTAKEGVEFPVPVTIRMGEKEGYLAELLLHDINRTNNREDYPERTDEEFANFRQITTTGMGDHLYRGSSPINPEIGRNTYADAALEDAKVTVIMNLANSQEEAEAYEGYADTYYAGQNIIFLNLGVDFQAADFQAGLANGLKFFAENEGVYYVHCTEGKDRAGFVSALLECLMGATYDEVVADYLKTYENYYTVVDGAQQPLPAETLEAIANSNIIKTLQNAFGVSDLKTADLAAEAEEYIAAIGLTAEEIAALKANLAGETQSEEPVEFEFLVTSDLHGQIFATDYTQPYANSGTYSRGLTRVSSYIKEQKEIYGDNVYVVDMGDTFQGAPLTYYYAFNKPEVKDPAILAFRTIGYDMWIVGNHEFNYGLEILNRQMAYAVSEGDENEKQLTISLANYLDAATNSDESKDWATWKGYEPYVIKDFDGYKVAVIGFGNPNVPKWDVPANWEGIYFANIIETYQHYEAEMLEQADMIVVVAHSGTDSDPGSDFMKELVESTDTIAFAFSGHEHKNTITDVENAAGETIHILSPYTKARRIAQVKVTVDGKDVTVEPELVNMEGYKLDEDLVELLQPYETDTWENYMLQPIGQALGDYPAADLGTKPSAFMDLINTVQTWGAYDRGGVNTPDNDKDDEPAMLSISAPLTSGSNANLISEGPIVLGDMFGLYRFENWFYQITMTGEEVHQWLEFAATKVRIDDEGVPYVTSGDLTYYDVIMGDGFHYDIDVSLPEGERVINMTYQGQPVAADQEFTVVVNNYRYNGGGNYVSWLNDHGCEFIANDPDRIIYSTQFDMIQGEDEGQARALLVSYIKEQTALNGGITPFITSDWTVQNGYVAPEPPAASGYVVAESVEAGDQLLYVVEYNGGLYAMTNDTSVNNAFGVAAVTLNEDGYIETAPDGAAWTLETGTAAGSFVVKDEDGKYITYASGTTVKLADAGTDFVVTCGAGTAAIKPQKDSGRQLFMRDNNPMQFRCYSTTNYATSGYCAVLTIYKYVP